MQMINNVQFCYSVVVVNSEHKSAKENWNLKMIIKHVNLAIVCKLGIIC